MSLKVDTAIFTSTATPESINPATFLNGHKVAGMYDQLKNDFIQGVEVDLTVSTSLTPEKVQGPEGNTDENTATVSNLQKRASEQSVSALSGSHRSGRTVSVLNTGTHTTSKL